jgi:hypothetical protein
MAGSLLTQSLERYSLQTEPGFEKPFNLLTGSTKWSVGSDRKWLVAVRGWGPFEAPVWPPEKHQDRMSRFTRLLSEPVPDDAVTVPVSDLLSWASHPGDDNKIALGRIMDVSINVCRLAYLLEGLPFKVVTIWNASKVADDLCLGLAAGGGSWRAYLAGFTLEDDDPDVEDFDPRAQQSIFDMAMSD